MTLQKTGFVHSTSGRIQVRRTTRCQYCDHEIPISSQRCPHCALPGLFPNVTLARDDSERAALEERYRQAVGDAEARGCGDTARAFESALGDSHAVLCRSHGDTMTLASGDHQLYGTYHRLVESELRLPEGSKWDLLRSLTDETLFGPYKKEVRFAALSLDGLGLTRYGDCSWVLREDMIAHRASVFEENSVIFMAGNDLKLSQPEIPAGHRATWEDRSKLCVAKLASKVDGDTSSKDFPGLLLQNGHEPEEDDFVEVHVGGPMTVRTLKTVVLRAGTRRNAIGKALRAKLAKFDVEVEERRWTH